MKLIKLLFSRAVLVGIAIAIQVAWFFLIIVRLMRFSLVISLVLTTVSVIAVLFLVSKEEVNPATKLAWVVPILSFPLFGGLLYLLFYERKPTRKLRYELESVSRQLSDTMQQKEEIFDQIAEISKTAQTQAYYISKYAGFPIYENTECSYYAAGEEFFPVLVEELKKAKHFIFMEYFIIEEGKMWGTILDVLKKKAADGVEVRLIYDDMGSLMYLPYRYDEKIEQYGIKCEAFNHFIPIFSVVMNHRDHRKITVIDGHTGFTGGVNIGDEYINEVNRYGYWKDNGLMLKGDAVWSLTNMFLTTWNAIRPTELKIEDFYEFFPHTYWKEDFSGQGYVQPYGDSPLDEENVGENIYLNMIHASEYYIYIMNPYIVIDNEMMTALCLAAKRGVDVRLVTPGQTDSKAVSWLADSYFSHLIKNGVKIYAYKPGFIHSKCFVCDDKVATVGTINLDYRSLYLHFECGVFFFDSPIVAKVKEDAVSSLQESILITEESLYHSPPMRMLQKILRLFAPLM